MPLDLRAHLSGRVESGWEMVDVRSGKEGVALLLKAESASRPGSPSSRCGAGSETDLLWIWFDPNHEVKAIQHQLLESCLEGVEPEERDAQGEWHVWEVREDRHVVIRWDATRPFMGLTRTGMTRPNP